MSKHYTAYQYDPPYQPKALRNWEVPHYYCNKPRVRTGRTRVISNNEGNLLPGVPRPATTSWGTYIGTWHLPRRIDRKTADILNGTAALESNKEKCRLYLMAGRKRSEDSVLDVKVEKKPEQIEDIVKDAEKKEAKKVETAPETVPVNTEEAPPKKEAETESPEATQTPDQTEEVKPEVRICPIHGPF